MSDEDSGPKSNLPRPIWYVLLFASSSFLLPSPVCMLLFTPLLPVFALLMALPFAVLGFALSSQRKAVKSDKAALVIAMVAGAAAGLPFWFAVIRSVIGGRYL